MSHAISNPYTPSLHSDTIDFRICHPIVAYVIVIAAAKDPIIRPVDHAIGLLVVRIVVAVAATATAATTVMNERAAFSFDWSSQIVSHLTGDLTGPVKSL